MKKLAIASAALLLLTGGLAAQDKPEPRLPRAEKVKIPLEALGEILKRHPNGRMLSEKDWKELLSQAGVKSLDDVGANAQPEKAPVSWAVSGATFTGTLVGEQVVFEAEASVRVLETTKAIIMPLPLGAVGARAVTVDGTEAKLVRGEVEGGHGVILEGAGDKRVAWSFSIPVEKGEEKSSGSFVVPLLRSSVATSFQLSLPANLEVSSAQCSLSVSHLDKPVTLVKAACGSRDAVRIEFRPQTAEVETTPYVTVEDASCFVVRRGLVQLELAAHFSIHRTGAERFAIDLPAGFAVRNLEGAVRDRNERPAPWGGNWVQRGDKVELALPKARTGELAVILRAELVAPQDGAIDMRLASYPGCARSSGLSGVARGEDMNVVVTGAKVLERADLDALQAVNIGGILRVYRHGSATGQVSVSLKPIEPRVGLTLRASQNILDRELRLQAIYDFKVNEGKVYQFRCELPESWRVDRTVVTDERFQALKHDLRTETKNGKTGLIVDLEGGVRAGTGLRVEVTAAREVPAGIASEKSLDVPALAGSPATTTTGYLAFSVDEAFRLKGDVKGLLAVPVEAIGRAGIAGNFALGFKVDRPDYSGSLALVKKETRIAARTLVYYQIDERTIATDAKIDFDILGAPVDQLEVVIPAEASKLVRIEGDEVAGDSPAAEMKDGFDHHKVRLKGPRSGRVTLFVHTDTQVAGFEKAEGAAMTKTQLPVIHAGEGCERERGALAVFSADSTEITAEPTHLHPIESTELEVHPGVKPAGRPLCAFTYAGHDWKLGIEIVRHEGAGVLGAIVEQLSITSSFGRDGISRHTAKFRCKNLSHQFFNLKVPEGAQIWSVLVDGVGVKPAAEGDQKIIPLTKAGSPDKPVEVSVTYEVKNAAMGKLGTGALASPVLLERGGGDAIPVLKTSWSIALPDEFRYYEFSGNAEGSAAAIETPLLVRWWDRNPDSLVLWTGMLIFVLALLAGEKSRARLLALGSGIASIFAAAPGKVTRGVSSVSTRKLATVAGLVVLAFVVYAMIPTLGRSKHRATMLGSAAGELNNDAIDDHVTKSISGAEGGGRAYRGRMAPGRPAAAPAQGFAARGDDANQMAPTPAPPPAPAEEPAAEMNEDSRKVLDDEAPANNGPADAAKRDAGPMREKAKEYAPQKKKVEAKKPEAPKPVVLEKEEKANLAFVTESVKDSKPSSALGAASGGEKDSGLFYKTPPTRGVDLDAPVKQQKGLNRPLTKASAFGEKGLSSLVLALPYVGKTWTFTHEGGPAEISFSFVRSDVWTVAMGIFAILGFASGFVVPRKTKVSYVGLLLLAFVVLSTVPYVIAPALTGGPVNAFLAGLALSAPVIGLLSIDRARLRRVRLIGFVPPRMPGGSGGAAAVVLGALLFATTPAQAQERRVYVPYDPEHPDKKQDKVFVPEDLYDELWKKAHPEGKGVEKPAAPAAYAISGVRYEGALDSAGLLLKARFRLEILREGWVEAPLGLEGASIKEQVIAPEGAKLRPSANGFALLAQGPKTFDLTLTLLLPEQNGVYTCGSIRAGAAVVKLSTSEKDKAIKVLGALGGQTETAGTVDASLGAAPQLRIAFGAREVIASGGGSDASVFAEALYYVRRGRVELTQSFAFRVSGDGREAFLFSVPAGLEVTTVETDALRSWSVKDGVLTVTLRRPCGRVATVVVKGESAMTGASVDLPELSARAVSREEGRLAVAVESGLKVRFGKDDGLRQIDPSEVGVRVRGVTAERAYAFSKRPAKLGLELLDEPLELKCTSRAVGVVRNDRFDVAVELEYLVKKGRTYELRVVAPNDLELVGDPEGLDVRERVVDKVASGTRYTLGLAKALTTNATAVLKLRFSRTLRIDDVRVSIPDVRALDVAQEDGEVALCVTEGLSLKGEKDVEADRFSSTDPEPIARALGVRDAKAQLGWRRKAKAPTGLSQATATIDHPRAHVEGTAVTFATVERDVVRTVVRVFYELSEAGSKEFAFKLPARLAKRVSVVAPNQREITFGAASKAEGDDEERVPFVVQLQSAVKNFYELTLEWEELVPPTGKIELARLDLVACDRVRAFILVEADPSLTDKLEASRVRANVETVRAEQAFALPPGKDPRDFAECFRAEKPEWRLQLELKAVEQQAPAPCRVETARVTSVIRDDGSVLHKAVWRVRNRSLQFLGVKLPKGAEVWTVHVAGEPKRLHTDKAKGISLIPLPKRADADMAFEVVVIYKTQLEGPLGLLKKVTPTGPVLATKDVTVERTFWTIHLPPKYDAAWTAGNMDETAAAVSEGQQIKARVQELAKLSSIAQNAKSENERQVAYRNIESNYALVQRDWSAAEQMAEGALLNTANPQKVVTQLANTKKELAQLKQALGEVQKRQEEIGGKQAQMAQQRSQNAQQLEVVYGTNKFVAQEAQGWRMSAGTFKQNRSMQFEGLETRELQDQVDTLTAQRNNNEDEKIDSGRKFDNERRQQRASQQEQQARQGVDEFDRSLVLGRDLDEDGKELNDKKSRGQPRPTKPGQTQPAGGKTAGNGNFGFDGDKNKKDEAGEGEPRRTREEFLAKDKAGQGGGRVREVPAEPESPAEKPMAPPSPPAIDAPRAMDPATRAVDLQTRALALDPAKLRSGETLNRYKKLEEIEGKKTLLSIGFEFEVPAGSEPLHYTTDSNADMELSLTVVPRTSVERGGRIGRALVVLLVLLSVVKLGLLSGTDKKVARALGLVVAGVVSGLVFVHVAFAAVAVVGSIGALIRARSLKA